MPNKSVNISSPILQVGEHFNVRWRLMPNGTWNDVSPKTNTPFVLSLPSNGQYQLEVTLVKGDIPCNKKYYIFDVNADCGCPSPLSYSAAQDAYGNITVTITSSNPSANVTYYRVLVIDGNGQTVVSSAPTSISSLTFQFKATQAPYLISIQAWCEGLDAIYNVCLEEIMTIEEAPCTGIYGVTASIVKKVTQFGTFQYYLVFSLSQSAPITLSTTVSYNQTDAVSSGVQDGGNVLVSPITNGFNIPILPNQSIVLSEVFHYQWRFYDLCGNLISGTASGF